MRKKVLSSPKITTTAAEMFGTLDDLQELIYTQWCCTTPLARDLTTLSAIASKVARNYFTKSKKLFDTQEQSINIVVTIPKGVLKNATRKRKSEVSVK